MAATTQTLTVKPAPLLVDYSLIIKNDKGETPCTKKTTI